MEGLTPKEQRKLEKVLQTAVEGDVAVLDQIFTLEDRVEVVEEKLENTTTREELETAISNIELQKGDTGNDGQDGRDGVDGKDGLDGRDGKDGLQGPVGPKGETGPAGPSGRDGIDGSPDTAEDIRNKLELLSGEERLDSKYIKGIKSYDEEIATLQNRTQLLNQIATTRSSGGGGVTDHGLLTGLADNDHTQYVNAVSDTSTVNLTLTGQSISADIIAGGIDHGGLAGLSDDDHSIYALLTGRSGGQVLTGGTAVTDTLSLKGTSGNGTLTSAAIQLLVGNDGATTAATVLNNGKIGFNEVAPAAGLEIRAKSSSDIGLIVRAASNTPSVNHLEVRRFSDTYAFFRIGYASGTGIGNLFLDGNAAFGGTAISSSAILTVGANITDPTDANGSFGLNTFRSIALTANNARDVYGGRFNINRLANAYNTTGTVGGGHFEMTNSNVNTTTNARGGSFLVYNVSTGTITNAYAGYFYIQNLTTGTITNSYGCYIATGFNNGTITNQWGLYQQDPLSKNFLAGDIQVSKTITAVGTTGNRTINQTAGRVNIAAGGTAVTVTNSLVTANSIVMAVAATNDTTATVKNVVPAAGSFTINTVAVTAETAFNFLVIN